MNLLDTITIDSTYVSYIAVALFILLIILVSNISSLKQKENKNNISLIEKDGALREKDLFIEKIQAEIKVNAQNMATVFLEEWKNKELETHRKVIIEAALDQAKGLLAEWKIGSEKELRQDAITRSMGVNFGKITEHLLPFSEHLTQFDPRDVRFIGSPVDLMIFDGATQKKSIIDIYLVEIKTGSGKLSKKQKSIRDAIEENRVFWKPIIVPDFKWDVPDDDEPETDEDHLSSS